MLKLSFFIVVDEWLAFSQSPSFLLNKIQGMIQLSCVIGKRTSIVKTYHAFLGNICWVCLPYGYFFFFFFCVCGLLFHAKVAWFLAYLTVCLNTASKHLRLAASDCFLQLHPDHVMLGDWTSSWCWLHRQMVASTLLLIGCCSTVSVCNYGISCDAWPKCWLGFPLWWCRQPNNGLPAKVFSHPAAGAPKCAVMFSIMLSIRLLWVDSLHGPIRKPLIWIRSVSPWPWWHSTLSLLLGLLTLIGLWHLFPSWQETVFF